MKLYEQMEDLSLIGIHVTTFPNGIKEAFDKLMKMLGEGRAYYGVSWMDNNNIVQYYAMANEQFPNEGKQYAYENIILPKGYYESETVHDWMNKTQSIRDIFQDLMKSDTPVENRPCVEWYKSDEEMVCMIKAM